MKIQFELQLISLPLRYEWKLSRNTSTHKINAIITARSGLNFGLGEVAPNIRYQETPDRVQEEFDSLSPLLATEDISPETWPGILNRSAVCNALKTGLDMAVQNLFSRQNGVALEETLGLQKAAERAICYTIPVMEVSEIEEFIERENLRRFSWLKVKVHRDSALASISEVLKRYSGPVAIDGNESWLEAAQVVAFAKSLPAHRILFLEQPLPASLREAYVALKAESPVEIWGDESVLAESEPDYWKLAFSGINVKLMKAGSLPNAVHLLEAARQSGLRTMVGCMVETSIGIGAALALESLADYMDLDGFLLLQNEPYHKVTEKDGIVRLVSTV